MRSADVQTEEIELTLLLEAIHQKYHYDFRQYSKASLKRRLLQAMHFFDCTTFSELQSKVLHVNTIFPALLNYLTVQVSEMFRDPGYFLFLRRKALPHLKTYPSLKVWVAGCSTGEELYSLVILFREEELESRTLFYATDINSSALEKAQAGIYELDRIALFTKNHRDAGGKSSLSNYYTAAYNAAAFDKSLRERVLFSDHSLVSDSVFGEMHLISCRNVLIYFSRDLQDRAVGLFKDSLVRKGFLGLGARESLRFSKFAADFSEYSREEKIYQKEEGS